MCKVTGLGTEGEAIEGMCDPILLRQLGGNGQGDQRRQRPYHHRSAETGNFSHICLFNSSQQRELRKHQAKPLALPSNT